MPEIWASDIRPVMNNTHAVVLLGSLLFASNSAFADTSCQAASAKNTVAVDSASAIPNPDSGGNYVLLCRTLNITGSSLSIRTYPDSNSNTFYRSFKPSTKAAGLTGENLGWGECAWVDRPLNSSESVATSLSISSSCTPSMGYLQQSNKVVELSIKDSPFTMVEMGDMVFGVHVYRDHATPVVFNIIGKFYRIQR